MKPIEQVDLKEAVEHDQSPLFCSATGKHMREPRTFFTEKVASASGVPHCTSNTVR